MKNTDINAIGKQVKSLILYNDLTLSQAAHLLNVDVLTARKALLKACDKKNEIFYFVLEKSLLNLTV